MIIIQINFIFHLFSPLDAFSFCFCFILDYISLIFMCFFYEAWTLGVAIIHMDRCFPFYKIHKRISSNFPFIFILTIIFCLLNLCHLTKIYN